MPRSSRVQQLREQGFDQSYAIPGKKSWKVSCSQCEALCINGIPCHETGCSNITREQEEAEED